jgi:hypothetical protein
MRNRVINGCCRVAQRGSATLSGSNQFGQVDRMLGSLSGSGLGGTLIQQVDGLATGMTYKRGIKFNDVSFTSGFITFRHRIERLNTLDLSGQTITVSAKIYHDYGSNATVSLGLRKPTAADNFTSATTIGSDGTTTVSTGTTTTVSRTYTLGSTDAENGLEIVIYHESRTVSVKNFVIGDIELQIGSKVGPFERRPYGAELALCQRYYYRVSDNLYLTVGGWASSTTNLVTALPFPVSMRIAPTALEQSGTASHYRVVGAGAASTTCSGVPAYNSNTSNFIGVQNFPVSSGLTAYSSGFGSGNNASAYLGWSAEL